MRTTMQQINRIKVSDQIIDQILSYIERGKLKVGEKLPPENVLIKQFGVGRSSLREAMRALSLVGVISVHHGRGVYVAASPESLSTYSLKWKNLRGHEKVEEIVEARMLLEQIIVQIVIQKGSEADIAELRRKLLHLQSVQDNRDDFVQADLSFHFAIAKASHNNILVRFLSDIRHLMRTWIERDTPFPTKQDEIITAQQHNEILEAIESRDVKRAQLAIRKHLER